MAPRTRFERVTFPLGGGCSIHLSYRGKWDNCNIILLTNFYIF